MKWHLLITFCMISPAVMHALTSYTVVRKIIICDSRAAILEQEQKNREAKVNKRWYEDFEAALMSDNSLQAPRTPGFPPVPHNELRTETYTASGILKKDDSAAEPKTHDTVMFVQETYTHQNSTPVSPEKAKEYNQAEIQVCREYYLLAKRP